MKATVTLDSFDIGLFVEGNEVTITLKGYEDTLNLVIPRSYAADLAWAITAELDGRNDE